MTTETSLEIKPGEVEQIVESVFGTMLGLELCDGAAPWFPSADRVTAAVQMTGDWNGAVLFECDKLQACQFAARFLSMDQPAAVDDVVRDVLGELANMIGGNLKCALTHETQLSTPSVVDGGEYSLHICGAEIRERLSFQCAVGTFWITVLSTRPFKGRPGEPTSAVAHRRSD
jgi:chemotaxis protein CheX